MLSALVVGGIDNTLESKRRGHNVRMDRVRVDRRSHLRWRTARRLGDHMCGVTAIITTAAVDLRDRIDEMTDSMAHRGPDDRGTAVFDERGVALGMRRLSIVDLEGGHQPMYSDDHRYGLVFNGEIYNAPELRAELTASGQRFRTDHSDTEVLLQGFARWQHALWDRLNGMFAVLIWDRDAAGADRGPRPVRQEAAVHRPLRTAATRSV